MIRKLLPGLLLFVTSCGLMGNYDSVEFMAGLEIPISYTNIRFGIHMVLKDQAINKIQEGRKTKVIDTHLEILKWKQEKANVK